MPTFDGVAAPAIITLEGGITSTNLSSYLVPPVYPGVVDNTPGTRTATRITQKQDHGVVPFRPAAAGGSSHDLLSLTGDWFERIFVIFTGAAFGRLHVRDVGNLLTNQLIEVEVWNADRYSVRTLFQILPDGPSGVTWNDPYGTPLAFNPLQSRLYTVLLTLAGAPRIFNFAQFDFSDLAEPVAAIRGQRVVPLPFLPNWIDGFREGPAWLTDIFVSADDSEQRAARRIAPRRRVRYTVTPMSDRELQLLDQLLFGWSKFSYGVPLWSDASRLLTAVGVGDLILPVATALRLFDDEGALLLIRDPFTWEAASIDTVAPTQIAIVDELQQAWPARETWVVPLLFGRFEDRIPIDRPTGATARAVLELLCEPVVPV